MEQRAGTLADERRDSVRRRILRGARVVFSRSGPRATMDDVADESGASRRTLFRYFPTKEALAIAAYQDGMERFGQLPERGDQPVDAWLGAAAAHVYQMASTSGPGLMELILEDGELGEAARMLRTGGRDRAIEAAREAWRGAGGRGTAPRWLVHAFSLTLSTFGRYAMGYSADTDDEAIDAATKILQSALDRALNEQKHRRRR